jgi:SAM-dependent MidA family methyltransferase
MPDGLAAEIRKRIRIAGPMPVAEYMALCLGEPHSGYYMTHDPLGAAGDFITAPEISQMFGELIGIWTASVWRLMDGPSPCRLIELGPGRGTMLRDLWRVTKIVPGLADALMLHLVETSPVLRRIQQETLAQVTPATAWHDTLREVPDGPCLILANEFFDALPVHQAVKQADGWHQRVIERDGDGFRFGLAPAPIPTFERTLPPRLRDAVAGAVFEWRSDRPMIEIGTRVVRHGGAALIIDYGHLESAPGDTFQAVRSHRHCDPLTEPGSLDLTAHVDFAALARAAESCGARIHGPCSQAEFLERLGIETRAEALKANATPAQRGDIDTALERLTSRRTRGMGELFKVMAVSARSLARLPGFDS